MQNYEMDLESNAIDHKLGSHTQTEGNNTNLNYIDTTSSFDNNEDGIKENSCVLQKAQNSSSLTLDIPFQSSKVSENVNDSTTTTQSSISNSGTQKSFGSKLKHEVRYVNLPAKFPTEPVNTPVGIPGISKRKKVVKSYVKKQCVNPLLLKNNPPCNLGDSFVDPLVLNPHDTQQKKGCTQNNTSTITESTFVGNENGAFSKPPILVINDQLVKLKGIKHQEIPLREKCVLNNSESGLKNGYHTSIDNINHKYCQTEIRSKSVVDQSSQTEIYSWIYKNSKLYTFIDDGGKQVTTEPVTTLIVARKINETDVAETDVASPLSSIDNDSDSCLEDEISDTDESAVIKNITKNTRQQSSISASMHIDYLESCHNKCKIKSNTSVPISYNHQPQNTFQEVLFADLGLIDSASMSKNNSQNISSNHNWQGSPFEQSNTNINAICNQELQMYEPISCARSAEPEFNSQPATISPDVRQPESNSESVVDFFNKLIEDIKTCLSSDILGNIPLHQAAMNRNLARLRSQCIVLKTIGSNLNHINLTHETALMLAVKVAVETEDYEAVSILVSEGADQCIPDEGGDTPLHYAVRYGCTQLVKILLTADDADKVTEKFNHNGFTPLHIAAMEGHDKIITLLVGTTININVKDRKNGRTPYFMAVKEKKWSSAKLLKIFGANISEPNFADQTPQHISSEVSGVPPVYKTQTVIKVSIPDSQSQELGKVDIGNNQRGGEPHSKKELNQKDEKMTAKRKPDSQITLSKDLNIKKVKLKPTAHNKAIRGNLKRKNTVSNFTKQKEKYRSKESKGKVSQVLQTKKEVPLGFFKHKELKINQSNESVLNNKVILNSLKVQKYPLNKEVIGQKFGNEQPSESTLTGKIDELNILSSNTVQGTITEKHGGTLEILEPFTTEREEEISNHNNNNAKPTCVSHISCLENIEENMEEIAHSNSQVNISINSTSHPQVNCTDSLIDKAISKEKEQSDFNCSSVPVLSNKNQSISSHYVAKDNLAEKCEEPSELNLSNEIQETLQPSSRVSEHNIEQTCNGKQPSNNSLDVLSEIDYISKETSHQEEIVPITNKINNSKIDILPEKNSPNTSNSKNTNLEKEFASENSKLESSLKPSSNIKPLQSNSPELVTIMRNKLISLVSSRQTIKKPSSDKEIRELSHLSDPENVKVEGILDKTKTKGSPQHIQSDSKTICSPNINKSTKSTDPASPNNQTQVSRNTSHKRSSDLEQEIERKRKSENNSIDVTRGEGHPTNQTNTWRRSARIPKKKVGFDL